MEVAGFRVVRCEQAALRTVNGSASTSGPEATGRLLCTMFAADSEDTLVLLQQGFKFYGARTSSSYTAQCTAVANTDGTIWRPGQAAR